MRGIALCLATAAVLLSACALAAPSSQLASEEMVTAIGEIADAGLECLNEHQVAAPKVSYDVLKTDSLIDPIIGVIKVETEKTAATLPDGTPALTIHSKYELTYTYGDGGWQFKNLEFIQGQRPAETDPVYTCFR
jgi:hypothetical protein